ncbi:MAG TPA: MFS transporter [Burkholderiales bacterium]|nr:MFS transporter [Burkholderiales bacterium]
MATDTHSKNNPDLRRSILLLASAAFVSGVNLRVADPLIPTLAHDFSSSVSAAASVVSAFTLAYALFQIIHGPLGDRIGKLRAVTIGMFIAAAAALGCAFAPNLFLLAVGRFFTGMGAAAVIPLSLAFIGDNISYERRQTTLGRFMGAVLTGQVLGPLIAGGLSQFLTWRAVFLILAASFAVVGFLLLPQARAPQVRSGTARRNPLVQYAALARDRWVRVVVLTAATEGFLFYGAFAYFGAYLKADYGIGYLLIGLLIGSFSIGGVVFSLTVKQLVARLRERGLALVGGISLLVCFGAIAAAPQWLVTLPFFMLTGLAFYMLHNTLQTKATEMAPQARGAAVSFFAFCLFLGQALGVAAFGQAIEALGYRGVFVLAGGALALLAWAFSRRLR